MQPIYQCNKLQVHRNSRTLTQTLNQVTIEVDVNGQCNDFIGVKNFLYTLQEFNREIFSHRVSKQNQFQPHLK